jgi:anaphase-promoting complex subunit 6
VFALALAQLQSAQPARVVALLTSSRFAHLQLEHLYARYLLAQAHFARRRWEQSARVLGAERAAVNDDLLVSLAADRADAARFLPEHATVETLCAAVCVLRGRACVALEQRARAVVWLRKALLLDPFCAEAQALLCERRLLSANAEAKLADSLLERLGGNGDVRWLADFYTVAFEAHGGLTAQRDARALRALDALGDAAAAAAGAPHLAGSADVLAVRAEAAYARADFEAARTLAERSLQLDARPDSSAMFVQLASLVELGEPTALFAVAHRLVAEYPKSAVAWHAVGCYYLARGAFDAARQHFRRATAIDASLGVAWLGFGRAFGALGEHDQAVAAYRAAARLLVGSHIPPLAIAQELLRDGNLPLAREFVVQASKLCSSDPLLWNEAGVIAFRRARYRAAHRLFVRSLTLACRSSSAPLTAAEKQRDEQQHASAVEAALLPPDDSAESAIENEQMWARASRTDAHFRDVDDARALQDAEDQALQYVSVGPRSAALRLESTLVNLGHCHRKLHDFGGARRCYHAALRICPNSAHTLSCLGVAYHVEGDLERAIDFYHASLAIRRDDSFTSDMLARAIDLFSSDICKGLMAVSLPPLDDEQHQHQQQQEEEEDERAAHNTSIVSMGSVQMDKE